MIPLSTIPSRSFFNYNAFAEEQLDNLKQNGQYRYFTTLLRQCGSFPKANYQSEKEIVVWCSNDYLGMGQHPTVIEAMKNAIDKAGVGAGGTRNISGNHGYLVQLEDTLSNLHNKEKSLVFTSGYVSNEATLSTLGRMLPNAIIYSDELNHASMIRGVIGSKAEKHIFRHNDVDHLYSLLKDSDPNRPKIIAFESVYSMEGSQAPLHEFIQLAKEFNALTYCDEVHAVGLYGPTGAGLCEQFGVSDEIDIIQGTLGKAFGCIGGYISTTEPMADMIRSFAPGYIFTTSLPPAIAAAATASIQVVSSEQGTQLRKQHQANVRYLNDKFSSLNIPVIQNPSHIIPIYIGDSNTCKTVSDYLLSEYNFYIQPINFPTVPKGTERLRITPTPLHTKSMLDSLADSIVDVFDKFKIPRKIDPHPHFHIPAPNNANVSQSF